MKEGRVSEMLPVMQYLLHFSFGCGEMREALATHY